MINNTKCKLHENKCESRHYHESLTVLLTESLAFPHKPVPTTTNKQQMAVKIICWNKKYPELHTRYCIV